MYIDLLSHGCRIHRRQLRHAEIEQLRFVAFGHEDVRRFDVAVQNSTSVCSDECVGNLNRVLDDVVDFQSAGVEAILQRLAVQQRHDDERLAVVFPHIVHGADIGVIERRGDTRLTPEAVERGAILRILLREELHGDFAAESRVDRPVDGSHTTAPELIEDAVVRYGLVHH